MTSYINKIVNKKLGNSGLSVSPLIVGCMSFGSKKDSNWIIEDEETVMTILKKCYDNGLRTFDTADVYSNGQSEVLLGKFIKKYHIPRERIVILTKVFYLRIRMILISVLESIMEVIIVN